MSAKRSKHVGQTWILVSEDGLFPDARTILAKLTDEMRHTYVYDSRDNRELKTEFFSALHKRQFAPMELPCES